MRYLLQRGEVAPGRALCLGDRPLGNDEGLAEWAHPDAWARLPEGSASQLRATADNECGPVPFISVAESLELVPAFLHAFHAGANAQGSAAVLIALCAWLAEASPTAAPAEAVPPFHGAQARALAAGTRHALARSPRASTDVQPCLPTPKKEAARHVVTAALGST